MSNLIIALKLLKFTFIYRLWPTHIIGCALLALYDRRRSVSQLNTDAGIECFLKSIFLLTFFFKHYALQTWNKLPEQL